MRDTSIDRLAMLLSTDWFFPYWSAIGLRMDPEKRTFLQQGCRKIVEDMIRGAEQYYLISFSVDRLLSTQNSFWELISSAQLDDELVRTIRGLLSPDSEESGTRWMLTLNTEMLLQNPSSLPTGIPDLNPNVKGALRSWAERQPERFDFNILCMDSKTAWDIHVRGLTPELPAMLADYVEVGLIGELKFRDLQRVIHSFFETDKIELQNWYSVVAGKLTGADVMTGRIKIVLSAPAE